MNAKLIILGCGSSIGVPRIDGFWGNCDRNNVKNTRSRCSAIIVCGSNNILIDTSPDIKKQLISNKIKNISSVIYTHEHADQTNGLFELRPFLWKNNKKINIHVNRKTEISLRKRFDYCFKKISYYPPIVNSKKLKKSFSLGKLNEKVSFKTFSVNHGATESNVLIFKKTAYISDCSDISIVKLKSLRKLNYLILDCLKFEKTAAHFNLKESLFVISQLKPKKAILTNLHSDLDYDFLLKNLPKNVFPAYDGLKINL